MHHEVWFLAPIGEPVEGVHYELQVARLVSGEFDGPEERHFGTVLSGDSAVVLGIGRDDHPVDS
jgi:hypothetical protein